MSMPSNWKAVLRRSLEKLRNNDMTSRILILFVANVVFMLLEFWFGFYNNSLGLISDACHMMFDCLSLLIGFLAAWLSSKPPSGKWTFGYGRLKVVAGFVN